MPMENEHEKGNAMAIVHQSCLLLNYITKLPQLGGADNLTKKI